MGFKNVAYIVMEGSIMCGHRITSKMIDEEVHNITEDASEAAVMSILMGEAGLNCQTMNQIIFAD